MCEHLYMCLWRPEDNVFLNFFPSCLLRESCTASRTYGYREAGWSPSSKDLPVFVSPVLRSQVHTAVPGLYVVARDLNSGPQVYMASTFLLNQTPSTRTDFSSCEPESLKVEPSLWPQNSFF